MEPWAALERAQPAEVGERCEVEVLGLGHGEAPDEEVEKAGVVHVYGDVGWRETVSDACRGCTRGGVTPPLRPGGTGAGARLPSPWPRPPRAPRPELPVPPQLPVPPAPPHGARALGVVRPRRKMRASFPQCRLQSAIVRIDYDVFIRTTAQNNDLADGVDSIFLSNEDS